jgi:flagellin
MRELAVQSANGTYKDELDREAIQLEVDALKSEIDRIASATEYNKIKLLDGSLGGGGNTSGVFGPRFSTLVSGATGASAVLNGSVVASSIGGVTIALTTGASGVGGENASWDITGRELTINLVAGESYTQAQIDDLIKNATWRGTDNTGATPSGQTSSIPDVSLRLANGVVIGAAFTINATVAGERAATARMNLDPFLVGNANQGTEGFANEIRFVSNNYGLDARQFAIATTVGAGKEWVETMGAGDTDPNLKNGLFVIHLATGVNYTASDIENIMRRAGLDYEVQLTNTNGNTPNGFATFFANNAVTAPGFTAGAAATPTTPAQPGSFNAGYTAVIARMGVGAAADGAVSGQGVGADRMVGAGTGLTFQIGANGVADQRVSLSVGDMSSGALGVSNADVSTRDAANAAIETIDQAISRVSMQRAGLGALQNRLESTVNNLTVTQENLTAAESQIRDTDMAKEMIEYTKFSILQQAAQAMLAQANQAPQAILQLLG